MSNRSTKTSYYLTAAVALVASAVVAHLTYKHLCSKRERNDNSNRHSDHSQPNAQALDMLQTMFQKVASQVSSSSKMAQLGNGDKLMFYGLYKQATLGDRSEKDRPSRFDMVARAKYDAWGKFQGMSSQAAMVYYMDAASQFGLTSDSSNDTRLNTGSSNNAGSLLLSSDNDDIVYSDDDHFDEDEEDENGGNETDLNSKLSSLSATDSKEGVPSGFGNRVSTLNYAPEHAPTLDDNEKATMVQVATTAIPPATTDESENAIFQVTMQNNPQALTLALQQSANNNANDKNKTKQTNAELDQTDEEGQTPLHIAADRGYIECTRLLVEAGANVNATDDSGISVLQVAVVGGQSLEVVKVLLEAGADPDLEDEDGDTARGCALEDGAEELVALFAGR